MTTKKFEFILAVGTTGFNTVNKARAGLKAFNKEVISGSSLMKEAAAHVTALVGAYLGFNALTNVGRIIKDADTAAYSLSSSLLAANREFDNIGSMVTWNKVLKDIGTQLKIYSQSELKTAAARTIDMTKRLGLSAEQMATLIIRTGDLSAGKFKLEDGIERVTAALRGEAEASEALGLTLNETYVKTWYEASGAAQGAWKDLTDLEKAQIRFNVFLEQAEPLAGKAAGAITTLGGAYDMISAKINDAISENQDMNEVVQDLAQYIADNADEIGEFAASLASWAASAAKWVVEHRDFIATVGKWGAMLYLVVKPLQLVWTLMKGMQAASIAMTGTSLLGWLGRLQGLALANATAFSALGATMVTKWSLDQVVGAYNEFKKMRQAQKELKEQEDRLAESSEKLAVKLKKISDETGVAFDPTAVGFTEAINKGLIHFDNATEKWKAGAAKMAKSVESVAVATEDSTSQQATITKEKLDEMKEAYKKYADEVNRLQDKIAGRERSLADQLREMARSGMSDLGAWKDRKAEAEEYYKAAQKAAAAGNYDAAVELADKAKEAYADLNTKVEENGKVQISQAQALQTSMSGVENAGQLAIEILKKQKEAAAEAGDALNLESGWQLADGDLSDISERMGDLVDTSQVFNTKWNDTWDRFLSDGSGSVDDLEMKLNNLTKDRHVTVYVKEVVQKALGGLPIPMGFDSGGSPALRQFKRLSSPYITQGSGLRDDVPALLKRREFVQPDWAVARYGLRFMESVRRGLFPVELARGFATGGTPAGAVSLGGGGGSVASTHHHNYNVTISGGGSERGMAKRFVAEVDRLQRKRS